MQLYQLKFPNGKSYIGITSFTAQERFKRHCTPANNKGLCQHAIHKYGKENVALTVLSTVDNWELLCLAEMEAIEKFNTFYPNGYNMTLGGEGALKVGVFGDDRKIRDKNLIDQYRKNNKESISKRIKSNYENNKEKVLLRQKERRELLREELNEWGKKHYHANKELISAKRKIAKKQKKINFIKQTGQLDIFA